MLVKVLTIFFKSKKLKSGQFLFTKNNSAYESCQSKKLLNLLFPPVLIRISGSGIFFVYKLLLINSSLITFFLFFKILLKAFINSDFAP